MEKYHSANVSELADGIYHIQTIPFVHAVIKCAVLDAPKYGLVKVSHYRLDGVAHYICKPGYKLVGNDTRKCYYDKSWTGVAPICVCK